MPYGSRPTPIGKRRDLAVIYARPTADDGMGGQTSATPTRIASIWVRPIPLDDRRAEGVMAGQLSAQQTYHFDTRYRTDLRPTQYFTWRGRHLEIASVTDDTAMRDRLILYCSEVQS